MFFRVRLRGNEILRGNQILFRRVRFAVFRSVGVLRGQKRRKQRDDRRGKEQAAQNIR